jgi:hypothetical protein
MAKWEVHIFGLTPSCLELEAATAEEAKAQALECVLDELSFEAELAGDKPHRKEERETK